MAKPRALPVVGKQFHHLLVLDEVERHDDGSRMVAVRCLRCGREKPAVRLANMRAGATRSCGCLKGRRRR
jgi:hypothetical protein